MDLNDVINIILIVCASGILFVLPSTIYTAMFFGVFHRQKALLLDSDNLEGSSYYPYREQLKQVITEAKQIGHTTVTIKSRDNLQLFGRYYDQGSDTTMLLVHGFQSNSFNNFSSQLKYYLSSGWNVLMIDQRAHGLSEGHFTTAGGKEQYDLIDWIAWLDENSSCKNIFIYGISMGATTTGLASNKIKNPKVKGLILEAGFTSFYEEISFSMGNMFMKQAALNYMELCARHWLKVDIKKRTTESLAKNAIPVLFLHGTNDKNVLLSHTEENFHSCASEKMLFIVEGAGHTMCHFVGRETVESKIEEFVKKHII